MAALTHPSVAELVHHHQLEDDVGRWNGDPGLYLKYTVPTIPAYNYLQRSSGDLLRLVQLVGGNFVFAQLAARYLDAAAANERPEALYMQQLESAASVPSADQHTCLRTLLRFIAQTGCGLTPDEISTYAHGVSADDVAIIVDDLRAVLTIKCDGEIVPHDASFSQFLLDMRAVDRLPPCLLF
ncbi:hypothetical protein PsYK624_130200 [Phanerochaete sordida]|uniref:Uncharacterized protein n=1 Tax=Phanerochaete sordida TaxID=48140 RepID=A0A9P3GNW4_9APHY|nr:hypothetical protein PsYK624_130200 [Phanerochaete sordida]